MSINVGLQAKCSRLIKSGVADYIRPIGDTFVPESRINVLRMRRHYSHKSRRKWGHAPAMTASLQDKSSPGDEIPERDLTCHLIMVTSLPLNHLYHTPVLSEYFLNNAYLLHI